MPRSEGAVDEVVRAVTGHIRSERLRPGAELPSEGAFAERLRVSRTAVREAFRSLDAIGVIACANGRRARVDTVDQEVLAALMDHAVEIEQVSVQQTFDVRRALELRAVALAAMRRSDDEAAAIRDRAAAMRARFGDIAAMTAHDIAFHAAIARASRNPLYDLLISSFRVVMEKTCPIGFYSRPTEEERFSVIEIHEAIADAVAAKDVAAAERHMAAHFDKSTKALVNAGVN